MNDRMSKIMKDCDDARRTLIMGKTVLIGDAMSYPHRARLVEATPDPVIKPTSCQTDTDKFQSLGDISGLNFQNEDGTESVCAIQFGTNVSGASAFSKFSLALNRVLFESERARNGSYANDITIISQPGTCSIVAYNDCELICGDHDISNEFSCVNNMWCTSTDDMMKSIRYACNGDGTMKPKVIIIPLFMSSSTIEEYESIYSEISRANGGRNLIFILDYYRDSSVENLNRCNIKTLRVVNATHAGDITITRRHSFKLRSPELNEDDRDAEIIINCKSPWTLYRLNMLIACVTLIAKAHQAAYTSIDIGDIDESSPRMSVKFEVVGSNDDQLKGVFLDDWEFQSHLSVKPMSISDHKRTADVTIKSDKALDSFAIYSIMDDIRNIITGRI